LEDADRYRRRSLTVPAHYPAATFTGCVPSTLPGCDLHRMRAFKLIKSMLCMACSSTQVDDACDVIVATVSVATQTMAIRMNVSPLRDVAKYNCL
jgi:hypothetical protein